MEKLTEAQVEASLTSLPEWQLCGGRLIRQYRFETFRQAISFVNMVASTAEQHDHHPDIDIRYDRVTLSLWTHDAAGITQRDLRFAATLSSAHNRQTD